MDAAAGGGAPPGELWRHTAPYRGLYAMTEFDADYFFGRGREIAEVIGVLAATPDKLPIPSAIRVLANHRSRKRACSPP